jgi:hypothetical protein
MGSNLVPP